MNRVMIMRPLTAIFAVWCVAMVVGASGGWRHAMDQMLLPRVVMPTVTVR